MKKVYIFLTTFLAVSMLSVMVVYAENNENSCNTYLDCPICVCLKDSNCNCPLYKCVNGKCEETINNLPCARAGEEGDVYGKKCCSGLTSVPINVEPYDGNCLGEYPPYGTQFLCIKCGDGVCDLKENKCNCPQDCSVGRTWAICDAPICKNDLESRLCVNCGNNVCDQGENICTCPEDCNGQESPVRTTLNIIPEKEENETRLVAELSNGRRADIKIMPETASQQTIEVLGLKVCSQENSCVIEIKEVGKEDSLKLVYEVKAEKEYRFLWIFKLKAEVKAEIDAENGKIISTKKPWWRFLTW